MAKQLYDSFGQVRVWLKDAVDLAIYSPLSDKRAERDIIHYQIFATIGLTRAEDCDQDAAPDNTSSSSYFTSAFRPTCTYDSRVVFDEEYVFDEVLSTQSCVVSIYKLAIYSNSDETYRYESRPQCIGYATVPVRRLEEHIPVSQWYQLSSSSSHDGLRSAIDLQVLYEKKGVKLRKREDVSSPPPPSNKVDVSRPADVASHPTMASASSLKEAEDSDASSDAEGEEKVEVGLADYAILCGPRNLRPYTSRDSASGHADSSPCDGKPGDLDVSVWDRYPLLDHPDLALPTRVEWFAAPEGTVLVDAVERPEPTMSTFVLSTSGMLAEQYGVCMTLFVNCGALVSDPSRDGDAGEGREEWWLPDRDPGGAPAAGERSTFVGIKLCILTRRPYFKQFSQVLTSIYYSHIESAIDEWESRFSYHFLLGQAPSVAPFAVSCERILVALISDCPVPVPATFSVVLKMTDPDAVARIDNTIPSSIEFLPPSQSQLPESKFPVGFLFSAIGIRAAIDVLACAMCEYKLLFHSTELSKLPSICESIRTLLYPVQWAHVYIPIVPAPLLSITEAPVPFLLGTHSKWLARIHGSALHDVVIIDCDSGAVTFGKDLAPVKFPAKIDRWLMTAMKLILLPRARCDDRTHVSASRHSKTPRSRQIQMVFLDVMVNMFRDVPSCIYYLGPQSPVFNRLQFLNLCFNPEVRDFLSRVIMTNSFSYFTDSLCKNERMVYFINRVKSLTQSKAGDVDEGGSERGGVDSFAADSLQKKLGLKSLLSVETDPTPLAPKWLWADGSYSSDPASALEFVLGEYADEGVALPMPAISICLYEPRSAERTRSASNSSDQARVRNGSNASAATCRTRTNSDAPLQLQLQRSSISEIAAVLGMVTERSVEGAESDDTPHPFILFGKRFDAYLVAAQTWTLAHIAGLLQAPHDDLREKYVLFRSSAAFGINNLMQDESHRAIASNLPNKTASTSLPYYLSFLLERVISGSILSEDDADIVQVLGLCNDLLGDSFNRAELIRALKLGDSSDAADLKGVNVVVRLSRTGFAVLSSLFNMVLEACTNSSDFITAYNLLIVGGSYYHTDNLKLAGGKRQSRYMDSSASNAEFLNNQIRHHPIYQHVSFWKAVIKDNTESLSATSSSEVSSKNILSEANNTMRLMHELGINADRALLVMQAISIDYNLDIQAFFDLQRQCSTLWKHNFLDGNLVETESSEVVDRSSRGGSGSPAQSAEVESCVGAVVADESLHTYAARSFSEISLSKADSFSVSAIDVSNNFLICGHYQNNIKIRNLDSGETREVAHGKRVSVAGEGVTIVKSLANNCFLSASYDGIVNIWAWPRAKMSDAMESPNGTPISSSSKSSSFFLGGSLPYSNKDEKMMRVAVIKSHSHAISAVTASTDLAEGAAWCIVSGDRVGNVSLSLGVEGSEGTESRSLSLKTSSRIDAVTALCFAEKGSVAGGSASGALSIMDHRSGRVFHEHRVHEGAVTGVLSLRSHEMMTVSRDRTARLWDTRASLKTQDRVIGGARHISAVCAGASWDNYLVACGSANGSIDMFDLRFDLAKPVLTFRGHRGRISSLHFDGVSSGLLRSASTDGCTRLWDSVKNVCMQTNHVYDNHVGVSEMKISSAEERLIDDDLATYATLSSGNRYCITRSFSGVIKVFTI